MKFQYRPMMPGELTSLVTVYQKNQLILGLGWTAAARDTGWHQSFRALNLQF